MNRKAIVVVGSQWGDEGKGKIVDYLSQEAKAVVRFQGGHNAGHTLWVGGVRTVLRLIPSGVLYEHISMYLGHAMVINPTVLLEELDQLEQRGLTVAKRLFISPYCHLLLSSHQAIDQARESSLGLEKIGTTGLGIGPCYEDKVARRGIRLIDLSDLQTAKERCFALVAYHNQLLTKVYNQLALQPEQVWQQVAAIRERLLPMIADVPECLMRHYQRDEAILFEGAQGSMLDIDHGTYPYVTSSSTLAGQVASGLGLAPSQIDHILGVCKGYTTRVGSGPMPTELHDDIGQHLARVGHEFGTNTMRPRRCGWLDLVALKRSVLLNGISALVLTKLDVLDQLSQIRLCVAYQGNKNEPVYLDLPGWSQPTSGISHWADLPGPTLRYIQEISQHLGIPVEMVSTGSERQHTACRCHVWQA